LRKQVWLKSKEHIEKQQTEEEKKTSLGSFRDSPKQNQDQKNFFGQKDRGGKGRETLEGDPAGRVSQQLEGSRREGGLRSISTGIRKQDLIKRFDVERKTGSEALR